MHANAFIADMEKAFLMIGVHEPDRDVLRFLWVKDPQQESLDILVMRFKQVTFGVTASPFLLNATIRHHIEKFKDNNPELVENLLRSVYVDDIISSTESKEYGLLSGEGVGKGISSVIEFKSYSSFIQLIRVTAYVLRFVECMKLGNGNRELAVLMDKAEVMWIKEIQIQLVEDHNFQKWKSQLQLYVDNLGIWRCRGRLMNADLPYHTKHPIVLPGWHFITTLLIRRAHERIFHNGVKETLNEL